MPTSEALEGSAVAPARTIQPLGLNWVVVAKTLGALVLGGLWAGRRLANTYFYFDEWSMIGRVTQLGVVEGATTSFNGHLWFFQDLIFRVQALVFGLNSNSFLVALFLVSLASLHLSLAALAVRVGVPPLVALALGGFLTYFRPAAQNFVFAVQVSPTFATASAIGAAAIVLGGANSRSRQVVVGSLMLLSTLFDSGVGLIAPAGVVTAGWYTFGDLGPKFEASVADRIEFAGRLVVRGAGALAGGDGVTGVMVLAGCAVIAAIAIGSGRLERVDWTLTLAAGCATVLNVAGIAQSRSGTEGFTFFENNRYLQNVGLPLMLTFLPACVLCARLAGERWGTSGTVHRIALGAVPLLLLGTGFVLGLDEEREYVDVFVERNDRVRSGVNDIGVIAAQGCPGGAVPDPDVRPLGALSPQISVGLIAELAERGLLEIDPVESEALDPEILRAICSP